MRYLLLWLLLGAFPAFAQSVAPPIIVGAALPQTGILADIGADLRKSLLLWQEEVNAAGGMLGRKVELQLLDDASSAVAAGALYEKLITEHKSDLLIGPLGSASSLGAAAAAERSRRVMINATGAARAVHRAEFRYVFQTATPLSAYGASVLQLARELGMKRVALHARDDPGSRELAIRAREDALAAGLAAGEVEIHQRGNADFAPQVARARSNGTEAWIAFGLPADAAEMVKNFRRLGYAPRLFVAQGASDPEFIKRVGQDAEFAVGVTAYERRAATRGNAQFVQAYSRRWSAEPGVLAAEGYAAGKVLEEAVKRAGSLDQGRLREVLAEMETETPLGPFKAERSGAQAAARPLLVQILRGRREIVWPEALATAKLQPFPAWDARKPLK
ncbi:MAG: amino acid ABC transporter substrate-binding protein [Candidatus Parcubacteria bacterium]|nr:amino acid ABC transporter substrate-binding protein [Burkholderiales bacterium]